MEQESAVKARHIFLAALNIFVFAIAFAAGYDSKAFSTTLSPGQSYNDSYAGDVIEFTGGSACVRARWHIGTSTATGHTQVVLFRYGAPLPVLSAYADEKDTLVTVCGNNLPNGTYSMSATFHAEVASGGTGGTITGNASVF